jgi:hypothetical protein
VLQTTADLNTRRRSRTRADNCRREANHFSWSSRIHMWPMSDAPHQNGCSGCPALVLRAAVSRVLVETGRLLPWWSWSHLFPLSPTSQLSTHGGGVAPPPPRTSTVHPRTRSTPCPASAHDLATCYYGTAPPTTSI